MKKAIVVLTSLLFVCGCGAYINDMSLGEGRAPINDMSLWEGRHISDLIAAKGSPQQVIDLEEGDKIMVWEAPAYKQYIPPNNQQPTQINQTTTVKIGQSGGILNQPPVTLRQEPSIFEKMRQEKQKYPPPIIRRMFWVHKNGIIYRCSQSQLW